MFKEASDIFIDMNMIFGGQPFSFSEVNALEWYKALSGILESFSWSRPFEKYTIHESDRRLNIDTKSTAEANHLRLTFNIDDDSYSEIVWTGTLSDIDISTYEFVVGNLIKQGFSDLCEPWISSCTELPKGAKFRVGDRVRTVIGSNAKTERAGNVFSRTWHYKRNEHLYFLLVNGKRYKKWYFEDDLEREFT